jgi:hypothetical protein
MEVESTALVAMGGLLIGGAFGAIIQRSHFCTMGCVSDAVLFGSLRRARVWALALAAALLGSQAVERLGLVDLGASVYRAPSLFWLGAVLGGLMFGFGMVLAGGCVSRNLARLGAGSLKSLVTLLVMAVAAHATLAGVLAPAHAALRAAGTVRLGGDGGADALLAEALGLAPGPLGLALSLVVAAALLAFAWRDRGFRRSGEDLATGIALGALVPAGWALTGWLAADTTGSVAPQSLTFVVPVGSSLLRLMTGDAPDFGVGLVAGTVLGATAVALARGQARLETFAGRDDMVRHLAGGALMGCGGVLALGCTIGQGLTGAATLAVGSWLALGSILAGGWWGVKHLETGRLLPFLPKLFVNGTHHTNG